MAVQRRGTEISQRSECPVSSGQGHHSHEIAPHRGQMPAPARGGVVSPARLSVECSAYVLSTMSGRGSMSKTSGGKQPSAFSWWLRSGKLPPAVRPDGLELKFNPWHDPEDGRFTFAGAGRHYGASGTDAVSSQKRRAPTSPDPVPVLWDRSKSRNSALPKAGTSRAETAARDGSSR